MANGDVGVPGILVVRIIVGRGVFTDVSFEGDALLFVIVSLILVLLAN